jgi:hypothetical protein
MDVNTPMERPDWLIPYPKDPLTRVGFLLGDVVNLAIILLIFIPVVMAFRR